MVQINNIENDPIRAKRLAKKAALRAKKAAETKTQKVEYKNMKTLKSQMSKTQLRKLLKDIMAGKSDLVVVRLENTNKKGYHMPAKMYTPKEVKRHWDQLVRNDIYKNQLVYGVAPKEQLEVKVVKDHRGRVHHQVMNMEERLP